MGRAPCCSEEGLNKRAWTALEDQILRDYIQCHGEGKWRNIPKKAGLKRCGKSCRLRWKNYLRPDIKRGNITKEEDDLIIRLHKLLGNRWSLIAGRLPGRTDNEIKNYWNTNLSKKVKGEQPKQSKDVKKNSNFKSNTSSHQQPPANHENIAPVELKRSSSDGAVVLPVVTQETKLSFTSDYDVEQLLLCDFSDSEFWKIFQLDFQWSSAQQPLLSAEEMLKDFMRD